MADDGDADRVTGHVDSSPYGVEEPLDRYGERNVLQHFVRRLDAWGGRGGGGGWGGEADGRGGVGVS